MVGNAYDTHGTDHGLPNQARPDEMKHQIRPRRLESLEWLALVRALPCLCCTKDDLTQITPTEAHHIRRDAARGLYGYSQKASDFETIPLCAIHHWNGVHSILSHREFERRYGNERDLLEEILIKLKGME